MKLSGNRLRVSGYRFYLLLGERLHQNEDGLVKKQKKADPSHDGSVDWKGIFRNYSDREINYTKL